MKMEKLGVALLGAVLLSACVEGVDKPSKELFAKVLDEHFTKYRECIELPMSENEQGYLFIAEIRSPETLAADKLNARDLDPYMALAVEGVLKAEDTTLEKPFFSQVKKLPAKGFNLTPLGQTFFDKGEGGAGLLCYGRRKVVSVTNFTVPSSGAKQSVARVNYVYGLSDVPDWAVNADLDYRYPKVRESIGQTSEATTELVLSYNGWMVADEFR